MNSDNKVWSQFFGQSSFATHSIVNKSSVVNAKDLIKDLDELKLFAPLGCGFQTGMGAIKHVANAVPEDTVLVTGLGAVGMGAVMVSFPRCLVRMGHEGADVIKDCWHCGMQDHYRC